MTTNREFTVRKYRDIHVKEGWGVSITPIWDEKDITDAETGESLGMEQFVSEIVVEVVEISEASVIDINGTPSVFLSDNDHIPVENFKDFSDIEYDDTHDLRDRWFPTKEDAERHKEYTLNRFRNPQPWEQFVML